MIYFKMKFLWIQIEDNYPNYQKFKIKEIINTMLDNNYINVNVLDAYLNKVLHILKEPIWINRRI